MRIDYGHHQRPGQVAGQQLHLAVYSMLEASPKMIAAAQKYEEQFNIAFDSLTHFPKEFLNKLHASQADRWPENLIIASGDDESILADFDLLGRIANSASVTIDQRRDYYSALVRIYHKLPTRPDESCKDDNVLFVGVEREGRILAQSLDWLPVSHSINPHAKRIPFEGGLLVGLTKLPPLHTSYDGCVIIDGAIASGSTIIAIIEQMRSYIYTFFVYSVHSSAEGIRAIAGFAKANDIDVRITVGHATAGINDHFYAVDAADPQRVIVGDLGDTISGIAP